MLLTYKHIHAILIKQAIKKEKSQMKPGDLVLVDNVFPALIIKVSNSPIFGSAEDRVCKVIRNNTQRPELYMTSRLKKANK